MADANTYLRLPSETEDERQARLLALLESTVGADPATSPHGALTSPAQPSSPTPITDRRYVAPPEPTAENSGITDLDEIDATIPPSTPSKTMPDPNPYRRLPGETEEEQQRRVQALYASETGQGAIGTPEAGALTVPVADVPPVPRQGPTVAPPDARQLALQINPMEELIRAREMALPNHTDASSRVFTEGGERPNFMGLEDEFGFKRDQRIQQARDLYGRTEMPPPERRWEDEYLQGRKRFTDDDIQRGYLLNSILNSPEQGMAWRKMAREEQGAYDTGLQAARDRDLANQRVSPALAQAIAGSGMTTPEAAVQLRMNDPIVKAFTSGGYSQGLRAEEMERRMARQYNDLLMRTQQGDLNRKANTENTVLRGTLGIQAALANKGAVATNPEARQQMLGSMYASSLGLDDPQQGVRVAQGDLSGLTPEQARKAQIMKPGFEHAVDTGKVLDQVVSNQVKEETARESKLQSAVEIAVARASNDRQFRVKMENDLEDQRLALKNAFQAWQNMSEAGKQAFVQFAPTGIPAKIGEFVKHLGMEDAQKVTENDRVAATALRSLFQDIIQKRAGVAVSESEWGRTAAELGLANGSWDPFNSPRAVGDVLNRLAEKLKSHRDVYQRNILDWGKR